MEKPPNRGHWHPPSIGGQLVVLRHHRPEDLQAVKRWYTDPEIGRLTRYQARPMTESEIERFFHARLLAPDALAYGIHDRAAGRLVGFTTFSALDPDNGSLLYHITIGERDAWGRGLGTEATELMLAHAFDRLRLHRVGLTVFAFNERAIRAYEKAGFRLEGRLREALQREGRFWDELQMSVLREEWLSRRGERQRQQADALAEAAAELAAP
ncbi:GNAT family protein [soil metagenome]